MDWFYTAFVGFLLGVAYLVGRWRGSKSKRLDCNDFESVKRLMENDLTILLQVPNGDLYRPTRSIIVIDSGKAGRYAVFGSSEEVHRDFYNNVAAMAEVAFDSGVSKEDAVYTMALAVDVIYNRRMEDKQNG